MCVGAFCMHECFQHSMSATTARKRDSKLRTSAAMFVSALGLQTTNIDVIWWRLYPETFSKHGMPARYWQAALATKSLRCERRIYTLKLTLVESRGCRTRGRYFLESTATLKFSALVLGEQGQIL